MTSLAAPQGRVAVLDCERDDVWERLFPRPATPVLRPPDGQQQPAAVDPCIELALELAGLHP